MSSSFIRNFLTTGLVNIINKVEVVNGKFHANIDDIVDKDLIARPRFSSKGLSGKLKKVGDRLYFIFDVKNAENAPGQHIVFYQEDILVGGGEINININNN